MDFWTFLKKWFYKFWKILHHPWGTLPTGSQPKQTPKIVPSRNEILVTHSPVSVRENSLITYLCIWTAAIEGVIFLTREWEVRKHHTIIRGNANRIELHKRAEWDDHFMREEPGRDPECWGFSKKNKNKKCTSSIQESTNPLQGHTKVKDSQSPPPIQIRYYK